MNIEYMDTPELVERCYSLECTGIERAKREEERKHKAYKAYYARLRHIDTKEAE